MYPHFEPRFFNPDMLKTWILCVLLNFGERKIQNGSHLFFKQYVISCILPVTIDFFHLILHRNNGHQAKLELYLIKTYIILKMTKYKMATICFLKN